MTIVDEFVAKINRIRGRLDRTLKQEGEYLAEVIKDNIEYGYEMGLYDDMAPPYKIKKRLVIDAGMTRGKMSGLVFSGKLLSAVRHFVRRNHRTNSVKLSVLVDSTIAPYAKNIEFGISESPHIEMVFYKWARAAGLSSTQAYNFAYFSGKTKERPYFRPAYRNWRRELLTRMRRRIIELGGVE